jgi:hypothetical protein
MGNDVKGGFIGFARVGTGQGIEGGLFVLNAI